MTGFANDGMGIADEIIDVGLPMTGGVGSSGSGSNTGGGGMCMRHRAGISAGIDRQGGCPDGRTPGGTLALPARRRWGGRVAPRPAVPRNFNTLARLHLQLIAPKIWG